MKSNGLMHALLIDGAGGARELAWEDVQQWTPEQGVIWLHFNYTDAEARKWIINKSQLNEIVADHLLIEETRPRTTVIDDGLLIALRGVNLNPGSDPEDMVSVRLWVDPHRIISTQKRKLLSIQDVVHLLEQGKGPKTKGEFIAELTDCLMSRMKKTIEDIEDQVASMEEEILTAESHALRSELSALRRGAISLRRYLAPQREAMTNMQTAKVSWLNESERLHLREVTDHLIRYIEDLDSARDRAAVTQEELINRLSEQMNSRMYVLSLVAAIFLPLGFLTGLLGINVGGIPGSNYQWGFLIFTLFLVIIVALQIMIMKRKKWL